MALPNIPYVTEIKYGILAIMIATSAWYVINLRDTVATQKNTITTLNGQVELNNQAVEAATKARSIVQARLDEVNVENKKLAIENTRLKGEIINRPDSKTCEEAMKFVAATAKRVAEEWNSK